MLMPLKLPPGVYRQGTDLQTAGRWRDANLVRWREGTFGPVGGWTERAEITDIPLRGAIAWRDNSGDRWIAAGAYDELWVLSAANAASDITPAGLTSGLEDAGYNTGYGGGLYGAGTYGTPRPESGALTEATTWALDTWGEDLVACSTADGKLYQWELNVANPAAVITNAPTGCLSLVVTDERFLFALGAGGNRRLVQWSDREDNTEWTPAATNESGSQELQTGGTIMCGLRVRGQTLILTDQDAHAAQYIGPPFVYGFERVGMNCGVVARHAAVSVDGNAYWMGRNGFFRYAGGTVEPVPCEVGDYIFGRLTASQRSKIFGVSNALHGEIWWFYPSTGENDSYVVYNYRENHWTIGDLARTAGVDVGAFTNPVWFAPDGVAYDHENGFSYDGDMPHAESGPISLGNGDRVMVARELIPDEATQGDVTATFRTRFYPNDTERDYGPYTMGAPTSVRFTGRQVRMRIDGAATADWRWGVPRLDVKEGGGR